MTSEGSDAGGAEDDPFVLIEKGNALEATGNHWSAAHCLGQAAFVLRKLAVESRLKASKQRHGSVDSSSTTGKDSGSARNLFHKRIKKAVELEKVARLYEDQSAEYLHLARQCLVKALKFEDEQDKQRRSAAGAAVSNREGANAAADEDMELIFMISDEEAQRRRVIFDRVFGKPGQKEEEHAKDEEKRQRDESVQTEEQLLTDASTQVEEKSGERVTSNAEEGEETAAPSDLAIPPAPVEVEPNKECKEESPDVVHDIEARLASFEKTIPSHLKPDEERMADIQEGFKGLGGFVLPTSPDIKRHMIPKGGESEEDQIKRIVEMAKDEARLEGVNVDGVEAESIAAASAAAAAAASAGGDGDTPMVINDEDDLAAVLRKAHLDLPTGDRKQASIADMMMPLKGMASKGSNDDTDLADTAKVLGLISNAQEMLFEATAYLEDDEGDLSEEGEAYDEELADDNERLQHDMLKTARETQGMKRGKESLMEAKKCIDKILQNWPRDK